ncbi:DUF3302 domain-containing protein [Shewanella oncorhynchi]|uniref:DUF3302 domain-containing protein n=1 Tax=Shewanella TaxID=22 RepID=UPI0021D9873B|nr:DUF3302 domain-containing protein [Shewanella sp. SM69]MCU8038977.1 DUF3302 domain-containing protein [Shewanella sp. SM69]
MFLDYFALGILFFVIIIIFYGVIAIHDIPYEIAKKRNHPQQDALHIAGWVSLFTLHAIWPFLWIWATLYREDRGWGFNTVMKRELVLEEDVNSLRETVRGLQTRLEQLEQITPMNIAPAVDAIKTDKVEV